MKKVLFALLVMTLAMPAASFAADLASDPNYKTKCAMCHGPNGEGKAAMKTGPLKNAASRSDAELADVITKGETKNGAKMPGFAGKLTPDQVKALVAGIKALK